MFVHVDMDAFYAAVEQRDHPELRGIPIAVGGSASGRGVVQTASYEAREYGVHSAMSGRRAAELCPHITFVRGRLDHYASVGREVREIFHRYTPLVQPLSLDEAFLDVSGSERLFGSAEEIGRRIRHDIQSELNLTASVGIAPRKFAAKIASDLGKPDGFVAVQESELIAFLDPLPIKRLWGVGGVGQKRLEQMGIHKIADIRARSLESMRGRLGQWGEHLWNLANGIDARKVVVDHEAKQISHERTFWTDMSDLESMNAVISFLGEQVGMRLRQNQRACKTVSVKYRREDFQTFQRSQSFASPTDSTAQIIALASDLLSQLRQKHPRPVRLLGVSAGNLTRPGQPKQLSLFEDPSEQADRKVDEVVDRLAKQFGRSAVYRAESHRWIHRDKDS
ncbi:DNA polymerase IV [Stieleria varia]|uniref:DNA polymerase IV n=1 Tax=Stieleria varia TaxID=2528005 RepID=A0A5C6BAU1_9BACT|nr:DNA polymerase IV [Stieleria varia]TWU07634.1 DNA polymerase IV [Stieleria varia]